MLSNFRVRSTEGSSFIKNIKLVFIIVILVCTVKGHSDELKQIRMLPFRYISGAPKFKVLEKDLPVFLLDEMNRTKTVEFSASMISPESFYQLAGDISSATGFRSTWPLNILKKVVQHDSCKYDFILQGFIWENESIVSAEISAVKIECSTDEENRNDIAIKDEFKFMVSAPAAFSQSGKPVSVVENLTEKIMENLVIRFGKSIRIAILDFKMQGGDTSHYSFLERSLPTMLTTGLSISSRIKLIEVNYKDTLIRNILDTRQASGIISQPTALSLGSMLNANYLIMGEFWEKSNSIRLDIRCVNIESREIVATRGVLIDDPTTAGIPNRLNQLAAELRSVIELDFVQREKQPVSLAVIGFPPAPYTSENIGLLLKVVNTLNKKLRGVPNIIVVENPDLTKKYIEQRTDRWKMSSEMKADLVLSLGLDRSSRDDFILSADLFDTRNPRQKIPISDTKKVTIISIDNVLNKISLETAKYLEVELNEQNIADIQNIKFTAAYNQANMGLRAGINYGNGDLFLDTNVRGLLEYNFAWLPFSSPKIQIDPVILKFEMFGDTGKKFVLGFDYLIAGKYKFRPYSSRNPYCGLLMGVLMVYRKTPDDYQFSGTFGGGLLAGIEQSFSDVGFLNAEIKWLKGFSKVPARSLLNVKFPGGQIQTIDLTIGFSWYL
ncbi:MAG: hypothetical protein KDF60_06000 [Calditrichaeota bacterium]|nr:hypothetical protein [Calditrichota bacterium]